MEIDMATARKTSDADRIVELYGRSVPAYSRADVVRLLGISHSELEEAIGRGDVTPERDDTGSEVIAWGDVALLARNQWTSRMVEAALGVGATDVIPFLNQHRLIRVSLPIYLIRLLDYIAHSESEMHRVPRNASDVLERVLHDLANTTDITEVAAEIRGFREALAYPYYTPRRAGVLWWRCRYCNVVIAEATREVCRACERRHEPDENLNEYGLPQLHEE